MQKSTDSALSTGHGLAVVDGEVWSWGMAGVALGTFGQTNPERLAKVPGLSRIVSVAAGGYRSFAVDADGAVFAWGDNNQGALGLGMPLASVPTPTRIAGLGPVRQVAAGVRHTLFLMADGTVMAAGLNDRGQIGNGAVPDSAPVPVPAPVLGVAGGIQIATGYPNASFVLTDSGAVYVWGETMLTGAGLVAVPTPTPVPGTPAGVARIAAGYNSLLLLVDGEVWSGGSNGYAKLGRPGAPLPFAKVPGLSGVADVAAGVESSLALLADGTVMVCGNNQYGMLGTGLAEAVIPMFTPVAGVADAVRINASLQSFMARIAVEPAVVAAPVVSPAGGIYAFQTPVEIALSTATPGAAIYYTLDGTVPGRTNGMRYDPAVPAFYPYWSGLDLKAVAVRDGMDDSAVTEASFRRGYRTTPPRMMPAGGVYEADAEIPVLLTTGDAKNTIYYTTDGSEPGPGNGEIIEPLTFNGKTITLPAGDTVVLKAIAIRHEFAPSVVVAGTFTRKPRLPAPTPSPDGGTVFEAGAEAVVAFHVSVDAAHIRYTLDGTEPGAASPFVPNGGAVVLPADFAQATVKAQAFREGYSDSAVAAAVYARKARVAAPTLTPGDGFVYETREPANITFATATPGAYILFTTDGAEPTAANARKVPGGATPQIVIPVGIPFTVKARAIKEGMTDSEVVTAVYLRKSQASAPTLSPDSGVFEADEPIVVILHSATPGATVLYTLDGAEPLPGHGLEAPAGTEIALPAGSAIVLKARTVAEGMTDSETVTGTYTRKERVAAPAFSPAGGVFGQYDAVVVTLSCATPDAVIRYTLDGSAPSAENGVAAAAGDTLTLPAGAVTLKAVAVKSGMSASAAVQASFTRTAQAAMPTLSPDGGQYAATQSVSVTVACATKNAKLYYTLDGSVPSAANGTAVPKSGAISLPASSVTLSVVAVYQGMANSPVAQAVFTRLQQVAAPGISPNGGKNLAVNATVKATLTCATAGATLRYTVDGSTPSATHGIAAAAGAEVVLPNTNATLKAIAVKAGFLDSPVSQASFTRKAK